MSDPAPKDFGELIAQFDAIRSDIAYLRSLKGLKFATSSGEVSVQKSPGSDNALVDLRGIAGDGSAPAATVVAGGGATLFTRADRSAVQSIANGVFTTVLFDTAPNNDDGLWSAGSPSRITVPAGKGGLYFGFGRISYQANANGSRYIYLLQNGVGTIFLNNSAAIPNGNPSYAAFSFLLPLAAGDYVEMQGYQDSGGALNMSSGGTTCLSVTRVGD